MSKNPFDLNAMANQTKGMKAAQAAGQAALTSAQEIAHSRVVMADVVDVVAKEIPGQR